MADGVIIDAGLGNVGSLQNMCRRVGATAVTSADPDTVAAADRLLLPGVGSFDEGMRQLSERGLLEALEVARQRGVPILGICLGMQLMTSDSEEGSLPGLGWFDAHTVRLSTDGNVRIPHVGWNSAEPVHYESVFSNRPADPNTRYYFVHSFRVECSDPSDVLAWTHYGTRFVSAIRRDSIVATQFHPEKSHRYGMQVIENFFRVS